MNYLHFRAINKIKTKSHRHYLTFTLIKMSLSYSIYVFSPSFLRKQCENKWFQLGVFSEFHRE